MEDELLGSKNRVIGELELKSIQAIAPFKKRFESIVEMIIKDKSATSITKKLRALNCHSALKNVPVVSLLH